VVFSVWKELKTCLLVVCLYKVLVKERLYVQLYGIEVLITFPRHFMRYYPRAAWAKLLGHYYHYHRHYRHHHHHRDQNTSPAGF
jgi:hypothetical protein